MIKIILNNDNEHIIEANEMNYSTTMGIVNYSQHTVNINLNITITSLSNIQNFENVRIQALTILNEENEEIVSLAFSGNLYIMNFNTNIYANSSSAYVSIGEINFPSNEEPIE